MLPRNPIDPAKAASDEHPAVALHRDPVGEWLCLRAATAASPAGSGLAEGRVDDAEGDCGRILQTLLIAERTK